MTRNAWGIVSGLIVLVLGVVAVTAQIRPEEASVEASLPVPARAVSVSTVEDPHASIAPALPGVPSRISRVLEWNGDTGFAADEELAQLPPTVAAVLTQYGVPLRIPITGDEG
jgi:hypothetical protein